LSVRNIMKKIIALVCISLISATVFAGGEKLIGTWKSNKDATLLYLKNHTKLTSQQLDKVATTLGQMTITFDAGNLTLKSGDWNFVSTYKVVSETKDSITIESEDPGTKKPSQSVFEFDNNSLWSPDDRIPGYKEKFDKVVQK
jgi:hypothetical protein